MSQPPATLGLYDARFEHDACGVGFIASIAGERSHAIVEMGIQAVVNLTHRGAVDADAKTGDGAGILTQIPSRLFARELAVLKQSVSSPDDLGVGMLFLPKEEPVAERCRRIVEEAIGQTGLRLLGWRRVPVDASVLGDKAAATQPRIEQVLIGRPASIAPDAYEASLYLVRKRIERRLLEERIEGCYIPSCSRRTIVYKGLFVAPQLRRFYLDLQDPLFESAIVLFHQRYSTNTFPNWFLAQPFRMLGHNGEINTLQGNRNWMRAREPEFHAAVWSDQIDDLKPIVQAGGSDSASLDNVLEALVMSGRDPLHAMMMLVPEAWENMPAMDQVRKAFYEYHACLMEPWDGPAALAFTDGRVVAAALDRNGLRPARYCVTKDGLVVMASEVGVLDIEPSRVARKGRLGPGLMIAVDTGRRRFLSDDEIKAAIVARRPYADWLSQRLTRLRMPAGSVPSNGYGSPERLSALVQQQAAFGYTSEDLAMIVKPMATDSKDPVYSMGDDIPLAVLSRRPRPLYAYFKQLFAQVTNPPIDPIREELVMSLNCYLGMRRSIFEETPDHARLAQLQSPIVTDGELEALRRLTDPAFKTLTIPALFDVRQGPQGLEPAVRRLCEAASRAVAQGARLLIVSDRGVDRDRAPIPMLLAVGAVHHHLIRRGQRMRVSLIAETGEPREIHHFAALIGYGASAVNPYLALESVAGLVAAGEIKDLPLEKALTNYRKAIEQGLLKIMSKMGISTITSYHGAQIFEVIGLNEALVEACFTGTTSSISGIGYEEIAASVLRFHATAYPDAGAPALDVGGFYRFRREGEYHAFNPEIVKSLQEATRKANPEAYERYAHLIGTREPVALRDLLAFKTAARPVPLEEVEPAEAIMRRFATASISHGALSREAHQTLAIAMNRIGAKSGSGEGGEDPARYKPLPNGDSTCSAIKQVASGRFGVTPEYLISARELEIKMAQGSKPGEGGQLPGHKVSAEIARIRHTIEGVTLISPPPHHDIYSIEDLAQLIYDLKHINPQARVAVKLVAEAGVGTIAAGVAKGHADVILISGHDGGTGASPLSSIKNAGSAWELGLSETQQVLVLNDLRGRVRLRTDGGMKSGRDVVMAALLGAEEYGFGTAALVVEGCVMTRQCHLNTCPVGVATQDPKLRGKYTGTPEAVIAFFRYIAEEVRRLLASLGARGLDEIIGRVDLLQVRGDVALPAAQRLRLDRILAQVDPSGRSARRRMQERNDWHHDVVLDDTILADAAAAIERQQPVRLAYPIQNIHRTVGAKLAGVIAQRYGDAGLPEGTIEVQLTGSAGQSFGAFNIRGVRLILVGEANDYVGKGMNGGEVALRPPLEATFESHENVILGNTVMYGATGGALYAAGRAGERFCVRNSGARAVVEGIGDHGCEYMTGGAVVILGETGRNFGAGMTGGVAFVLDERGEFPHRYNPQLVVVEPLQAAEDVELVRAMVLRHLELTGSPRAETVLARWDILLPKFWKVHPKEQVAKIEAALAADKVGVRP